MQVIVTIEEGETKPSSLRPRPKWYVSVKDTEVDCDVVCFTLRETSAGGVKLRSEPEMYKSPEGPAIVDVSTTLRLAERAWNQIQIYTRMPSAGLVFQTTIPD